MEKNMIEVIDNKTLKQFVIERAKQKGTTQKAIIPAIAKILNVTHSTVNGYLLVSNPQNLSERNARLIQSAIKLGKL